MANSRKRVARSVQQAANGSDEVVENIHQVSRGAVATGTAADEVHGASETLSRDRTADRDSSALWQQ
jgi:hypothetical protein